MKSILKSFSIVAFVLAIMAAFAFNTPSNDVDDTTWFAVEENGAIITPALSMQPACAGTGRYCAVEFDNGDLDNGQPPVNNVEHPDAEDYYITLDFKNP